MGGKEKSRTNNKERVMEREENPRNGRENRVVGRGSTPQLPE